MALTAMHGKAPIDLSKKLIVIGAGYSRTGTLSFSQVLERLLDGPVCHTGSACLMREEAFIKKWISILDPAPDVDNAFIQSTLKDLFSGYVALTDNPGAMFVEELVQAFPDAKVIVTTRDADSWWESIKEVEKALVPWWLPKLWSIMPTLRYFGEWHRGLVKRSLVIYGPQAAQLTKKMLSDHTEYLRRVVPADRLYFISLKEGWGPICKILDCPVPDEPFPHANDKYEVQRAIEGLVKNAMLIWLILVSVFTAVLAVGWQVLSGNIDVNRILFGRQVTGNMTIS